MEHVSEIERPQSPKCPECGKVCANEHGLRMHFGHMHSHKPWPWTISKPPLQNPKPRRERAKKDTLPRWR